MSALGPAPRPALVLDLRASAVHLASLGVAWLAFAVSGFVFTEPAPYDVLMFGLIVMLPLLGLVRVTPQAMALLGFSLIIAAAGLLASTQALRIDVAARHTVISLYLSMSAVLVAGFIAANPERHTRLVLAGYATAAVLTSAAALAGYFGLVPGADELFTLYGRARGGFQDPNVLGPFLVPILLYATHRTVEGGPREFPVTAGMLALVLVTILLTFSRGAWFNAVVSLMAYAVLALMTAPTNRGRLKLIVLGMAGLGLSLAVLAAALQVGAIAELFAHRATLVHEYDVGPEGRFGGQLKAIDVLLRHPLGLGALEFSYAHHHEDAHNAYLSMFLNAGWIGGFAYLGLVSATILVGLRQALRASPLRGVVIVAVASFVGIAAEGVVIDTDHWRHFYVLLGLIWGLAAAPRRDA